MTRRFAITFDYLCPFARNANEHVVAGLQSGADWNVTFIPYSLAQGHIEEGDTAIWDRDDPNAASGALALQAGITVRDQQPDQFLDAHRALFAARHDEGLDIKDPQVVRDALTNTGVDAEAVFSEIDDGTALEKLRKEHESGVAEHQIWGVPTFVTDRRAVFVRLMDRPGDDTALATRRIEHVIDLVDEPIELHEFKQVDLPR